MVIIGKLNMTSDGYSLSCKSLKLKVADLLLHKSTPSCSALWTGATYCTAFLMCD